MARITSLRRLDPDGPLDAVQAVVPMTGEVIEIRMAAARPFMLQLLAQPQMGILSRDGGTGPYRAARQGDASRPRNGASCGPNAPRSPFCVSVRTRRG